MPSRPIGKSKSKSTRFNRRSLSFSLASFMEKFAPAPRFDGPFAVNQTGPKPTSIASTKSTGSQGSVASVGIGDGNKTLAAMLKQAGIATGASNRPGQADAFLKYRPMPQGPGDNRLNIYEQHVYDCVTVMIVCSKHQKVALPRIDTRTRQFTWLPFVPVHEMCQFGRSAHDCIAMVLGSDEELGGELDPTMIEVPSHRSFWLNVIQMQVPGTRLYYTQMVQGVRLHESDPEKEKLRKMMGPRKVPVDCCRDNCRLQWHKVTDLLQGAKPIAFWGDEVMRYLRETVAPEPVTVITNYHLDDINTLHQKHSVLKQLNWSLDQLTYLNTAYLHHMYPALCMTVHSFRCFLLKHSVLCKTDRRFERLFRACSAGADSLSFTSLVLGLAAMDPKATNHSEARANFIFHYYNTDRKSALSSKQMSEMAADLQAQNQQSLANLFISHKASGQELSCSQLLEMLLKRETVPTTDRWLRLNRGFFDRPTIALTLGDNKNKKVSILSKVEPNDPEFCIFHQKKNYMDYGQHSPSLDRNDRCTYPLMIGEPWVQPWNDQDPMSIERYSTEIMYYTSSVPNNFINLVRSYWERERGKSDSSGLEPAFFLTNEREQSEVFQIFDLLIDQVTAILRLETKSKLLRLNMPVNVVGDIQGSLRDLFVMDKTLFRLAPLTPTTTVFLGNYNGPKGRQNLECIVYLFALKVVMPNKLYLLRGNNELFQVNKLYLLKELSERFGSERASKLLEQVNAVFDLLPLAVVVGGSILCVHSGIPRPVADDGLLTAFDTKYSTDQAFPIALRDLQKSLPLAYEMMTNLPEVYRNSKVKIKPGHQWTSTNTNGHEVHYFGLVAFNAFMKANKLSYLVRSHTKPSNSVSTCFAGRCFTVYSSRKYLGKKSKVTSALMITKERRIRILRFE